MDGSRGWIQVVARCWWPLLLALALASHSWRPAAVPRLAKGAPNAWSMAKLSELCQQQGVVSTLRSKGVAILPQAFEATLLERLLKNFRGCEEAALLDDMRFGDLRAGRTPLHLPFREPFRSLPLLGQDESLRDVLTEYLGEDFELESAMVIKVGPGANAQSAHMDTEDLGSLSVHVPLHPLHKDFAPLSFLLSTHEDPSIMAPSTKRWVKNLGIESRGFVREEHRLARQRQRTAKAKEEQYLQWGAKEVDLLADVDFRRGQGRCLVLSKSEPMGLEPGDEVTHVNELDFMSWLQVKDFIPEFRENLLVRVLRPIKDDEEETETASLPSRSSRRVPRNPLRTWMTGRHQDKLLVGAPLQLGDALIYDSRTVHWGMANRDWQSRYVLYLNFKRHGFDGTSPDTLAIRRAARSCRWARKRFREKLVRELHYLEDGAATTWN